MIGMITPNVFAIHHQSSDTLPESFTMTEIPNAVSSPSSPAPGFYEISQYAIGTVGIQIIFVESDGSADTSKYDWSESKMKITEANIKKGLEFLEDKYPFEVGKLEFSYRPSMIGETGVEASTRVTDGWFQHEDYVELVEDALTDTGCGSKTESVKASIPDVRKSSSPSKSTYFPDAILITFNMFSSILTFLSCEK